ncbi:hypothetical protein DNF23_18930 [Pseudomonas syringae pv. pisi]|jgi:type I restriction enzyme M protein
MKNDYRITDAAELLRKIFADPVELAAYLAPIVLLKYLNTLKYQNETKINIPNIANEDFCINFPESADIFLIEKSHLSNDIGKVLNQSLRDLELLNPSEMRSLFVGLDYSHPRFGSENDREEILREIISITDQLDAITLKEAALSGSSLTDFFFSSLPSTSRSLIDFATPFDVADLLSSIVSPQDNDNVYDGACGSGQLLLSFLKKSASQQKRRVRAFGAEKNYLPWIIARLNFIFCGFKSEDIDLKDTILEFSEDDASSNRRYNVILSNPPKSQRNWEFGSASSTRFQSLGFGIPPKLNGDFAFVLEMLSRLCPHSGRMAVILADGALFRQGSEEQIRENLLEKNLIEAVISLPTRILYNISIGVSILVLNSGKSTNKIMMINARDFSRVGKLRNELPPEAIAKIISALQDNDEIYNFARIVTSDEIRNSNFSLLPQRYFPPDQLLESTDLEDLSTKRRILQQELIDIETELDHAISTVRK